jgi:GNAT superfamily N-acetyltransferase
MGMISPTIRPAVQDDLDAMVSLLQALFAIEQDFQTDPDRQRRGLALFLDGCGKHRRLLVAEINAEVIAMASIQILVSTAEGGPVGLVEDLVVQKAWRGRGVGRLLLKAVSDWAANHNLTRLQLLADSGNQSAIAFYRNVGWQVTQLICLRHQNIANPQGETVRQ